MDRWSRPAELHPGWTQLRRVTYQENSDVVFVPSPRPHHTIHVEVVSAAGPAVRLVVDNVVLVASMRMVDGNEARCWRGRC